MKNKYIQYAVWHRFWYEWLSSLTRARIVALLRPLTETRVPHGLRTVAFDGRREIVSAISLERLQRWVTWRKFSRRDKRVMREEIARKRVLLAMGYPTADEIRTHYRQSALGKKTPLECETFEARLIVKP